MIGYRLLDTLSAHGGVSRGICECSEDGYLEHLLEVKNITREEDNIAGITTVGDSYTLQGHETVSMNIWALTPDVFPTLQNQFTEFLTDYGSDPNAEFLISSALHEQIVSGTVKLKVIAASDRWFGMTFQADRPIVAREIGSLIERGVYPADLRAWFQEKR
jgi:hypothetical protein